MGKHPAPIFQHPIIRIINDSHLRSSFDPRAWYKQSWGFAESGAQQSSAYPPSHHPQQHKSQKNAGISTRNFYLLTLGLSPHPLLKNHQRSSSSSGKRPDTTQIAGEGVWGLLFGFGVSLFQASMGSAELELSQGSHTHPCKILT